MKNIIKFTVNLDDVKVEKNAVMPSVMLLIG